MVFEGGFVKVGDWLAPDQAAQRVLPEMLFFNFRRSMQHFKSKSSFWP
jgi:hypothetical protein